MAAIDKTWRDGALRLSTLPLFLLMAVFFIVPLGMTALLSFQGTQYYRLVWTWDLKVWADVFSQAHYWKIMWRTLVMALICTVLCTALAIPIAYGLVNRLSRWSGHITLLMVFAFLTDAVLKTFGWVLFLDRSGVLNGWIEAMGFGPAAVNVLFTPMATMIGMIYNLLPYAIFTTALSMARIDRDLVLACYDAGASRLRGFAEVTLPLARPGILAGAVLVFVLSLGVFLEPKVMGGGTSPMAAELIRQSFETRVNWPLGAALTIVLIVIGAAVLAIAGFIAAQRMRRTS